MYTASLMIMAALVIVGMTINPLIGLALLISAVLAVACTYRKRGQ
jgi:hypothetical protein